MPQSSKLSRSGDRAAPLLARWLAAGLLTLPSPAIPGSDSAAFDAREVYSGAAPRWLRAVGKLQVPGSKYHNGQRDHLQEDCSATLVTRRLGAAADTIVTAWHCLVHYNDLSRPIVFTLLPDAPDTLQREAFRLADGGGMHADWALLRLRRPVAPSQVVALVIQPDRADPGRAITMAGYSRDEGKGQSGRRLTFDPACLITAQADSTSDSNCRAHKGASGGAVVQLSPAGTPQFSGVVSQGDGVELSTFVPVEAFRGALKQYLEY